VIANPPYSLIKNSSTDGERSGVKEKRGLENSHIYYDILCDCLSKADNCNFLIPGAWLIRGTPPTSDQSGFSKRLYRVVFINCMIANQIFGTRFNYDLAIVYYNQYRNSEVLVQWIDRDFSTSETIVNSPLDIQHWFYGEDLTPIEEYHQKNRPPVDFIGFNPNLWTVNIRKITSRCEGANGRSLPNGLGYPGWPIRQPNRVFGISQQKLAGQSYGFTTEQRAKDFIMYYSRPDITKLFEKNTPDVNVGLKGITSKPDILKLFEKNTPDVHVWLKGIS
jgi:hypothetical protein